MEKELLSIVETFREFRSILYGCAELHIHTDHKNLTYTNLNSQRVMRWRLFIEEYFPQFHYIKGKENTLADALSRLPRQEDASDVRLSSPTSSLKNTRMFRDDDDPLNHPNHMYGTLIDEPELAHCMLSFPKIKVNETFALDFQAIAEEQMKDEVLKQFVEHKPNEYRMKDVGKGHQMILRQTPSDAQPRVCIPTTMLDGMIQFYHRTLGHPGTQRVESSIKQYFYHRNLHDRVTELIRTCDSCQRNKMIRQQYGELPERQAHMVPWRDLAVDLCGPWTIRDKHGFDHTFTALTVIDVVTNYVEIIRLNNNTAEYVAQQFENNWIARYPRPVTVIYDPGPEFKGAFKEMLNRFGIIPNPTTVKNPQANAICERLHQTMAEVIRTTVYEDPPEHFAEATHAVDTALATAAYAARSALHITLGLSPGALVYNRDMLLDIPVIADWEALQQKRQIVIQKNLKRANQARVRHHDYAVGDKVLKLVYKPRKLQPRAEGPYPINRVHVNGTVTVQRTAMTTERLNIRRIRPYWERRPWASIDEASTATSDAKP